MQATLPFDQLTTVSTPVPIGVRNPPRNAMITTSPPRGETADPLTELLVSQARPSLSFRWSRVFLK
jgi:hypothetical protein